MNVRRKDLHTTSDATLQTPTMPQRQMVLLALLIAAALALTTLPVASASAASPWWQVLTGGRPTSLHAPESHSEVQEVTTTKFVNLVFAGRVEVGATIVGCLGTGLSPLPPPKTADQICEEATGHPAAETAVEFQAMLEGAYGAGQVSVTGGPVGSTPFEVSTMSWVPPVRVTPIVSGPLTLGTATSEVLTGGSGRLVLNFVNLGSAEVDAESTPLIITDELPQGVAAYDAEGFAGYQELVLVDGERGPVVCTVETISKVTCTYSGRLSPYDSIEAYVYVSLVGATGAPGQVTISGANAPRATAPQQANVGGGGKPPFGLQKFSARAEAEGGGEATQAGSHPYQFTTTIELDQGRVDGTLFANPKRPHLVGEVPPQPRETSFTLPAGLVGNATAQPRCPMADFYNAKNGTDQCPAASQVGAGSITTLDYTLGVTRWAVPVFNLPPGRGEPARFGITVANIPIVIETAVVGSDGYRVRATVKNISQLDALFSATVSLWGDPGDPIHDQSRGFACIAPWLPEFGFSGSEACALPPGGSSSAFMRMPTSCGSPLRFNALIEAWNTGETASTPYTGGALDGCDRVPFEPSIDVRADTHAAESPIGLAVHLKVPQEASESPSGIATSDVRDTRVALPPGLHINPAAASGLQACSEDQIGFEGFSETDPGKAVFSEGPAACPEASKLGRVKITSPLIEEPVTGWVYQAAQRANPFGSLLALYVDAEAPGAGVHVKLAGRVDTDTQSGQVVSTFAETPQLPFSEFELSIFGGSNAPLATSTCGAYRTATQIEPWSGGAAATPSSEFNVSGCANPQRFQPTFSAGTENPPAGAYAPFVLNLRREDGEAQLSRIDTVLPKGLTSKLAGIPYCPESSVRQAEARSNPGEGAIEKGDPSCPAASQVGTVRVGAGVGPQPYVVGGSAYLAGPYKGAPLSLVIVTPAVAGPFDLGTVVVRTALYVNEETAQITAKSDPLPTILQGIPLDVRSIALKMDRPDFTLNPTNCEAMAVTGTATSTTGKTAALHTRFRVDGCKGLDFEPKLKLSLKGATKRSGHPALKAVVTYPAYSDTRCAGQGTRAKRLARKAKGERRRARRLAGPAARRARKGAKRDAKMARRLRRKAKRCPLTPPPREANIARAQVGLPHSEFLDQGNLNKVCKQADLRAATCPKSSIYGHAKAWTPLLDKPLQGPVYLGVGFGYKLPALVADLNGQIRILLVGRVDTTRHKGIRNTFEVVPDAPVSRFVLKMKGGKRYGLIENSEDLCRKTQRASALFNAQNGLRLRMRPKIHNDCGKKARKGRRRRAPARASWRRDGAHRAQGRPR